jgi:hypothetical protein
VYQFRAGRVSSGAGHRLYSSMSLVTTIALLRCTIFGTAIWPSTSSFSKLFVWVAPEPFVVPYCMVTAQFSRLEAGVAP